MAAADDSVAARVLVVAHRTAATPRLIEAVRARAKAGPCTFTLLVPRGYWDPDTEASSLVLELALPLLEDAAGAPITGVVGASDPLLAVREASPMAISTTSSSPRCLRACRTGSGATCRAESRGSACRSPSSSRRSGGDRRPHRSISASRPSMPSDQVRRVAAQQSTSARGRISASFA